MVRRDSYLRELESFIGKPFIKVLTGIRRCGKSSILLLLMDEFKRRGIPEDRMLYINFENLENSELRNSKALYSHIKARMSGTDSYHILLDEIQEVESWEQAVNSLLLDERADIYITGSNSRLLSSELATYIAGRYVEFRIKPLSFGEFLQFRAAYGTADASAGTGISADGAALGAYIRLGGFPGIHTGAYTEEESHRIVSDIYASAILRDIIQRQKIRNVEMLERIVKFVFDNVGNTFSAKSIADYFRSRFRRPDPETVYNYLNALEAAFIIQRIPRYDVRGKEILKTREKYYAGDHALPFALTGYRDRLISGVLENVVLNELQRRGYRVFAGQLGDTEIDFVGERRDEKIYVQVAYALETKDTVEREFRSLLAIKDQHPKYVVSLDSFFRENYEGVRYMPLGEFL
ncbi:MAG: ATP-binding protein, partial [Treponema sp.]|nr:ATP-binding protein [Treponema sp.]